MIIRITFFISGILILFTGCTKDKGRNPALAYNDLALLDSCQNIHYTYNKNDPSLLLAGTAGPHGTYKLRFNSIANKALGSNGKLLSGVLFPEGSMLIKDVYSGGNLTLYAYMYKKSGTWLWGEIRPNKEVLYSVTKNPSICIDCHSQTGNSDLSLTFKFY